MRPRTVIRLKTFYILALGTAAAGLASLAVKTANPGFVIMTVITAFATIDQMFERQLLCQPVVRPLRWTDRQRRKARRMLNKLRNARYVENLHQ